MTAFLATDRCDRCGAQAKTRVELRAGDLLFCAHHYREHEHALAPNDPAPGTTPTPRATTSGDAGHNIE